MRQAMRISVVALCGALAGIVGIQMGKDAIREVDPRFFAVRSEPMPFYDGLEAAAHMPRQAEISGGEGYYTFARPPVCWGCPEQPDPYRDAYLEPFVDPLPVPVPPKEEAMAVTIEKSPRAAVKLVVPNPVERYASFPITEEESRQGMHMAEYHRDGARQSGGTPPEQPTDM